MKIALLAPISIEEKVKSIEKTEFKNINIDYITYNDYKEVTILINSIQEKYDALVFAGFASYSYAQKHIKQEILWDYFPRHVMSFLNALLKASFLGYNIQNISCDTYSKEYIDEAYNEIGLDKNHLNICQISDDLLLSDNQDICDEYNKKVVLFHKKNYLNDKRTCIITGLYTVHNELKKEGIFSFTTYPTVSVIKDTLNKLYLKYLASINQNSQIVVISIEIDMPNEYSVISKNEYFYMKEKMKILDLIYSFSQNIKATIVEVSYNTYLLFSTKNMLETETNHFKDIKLLNDINKNSLNIVSMGIGYGSTVQEAKYNATLGMDKSKEINKNSAYIVYEDNKIEGPILENKNKFYSNVMIDEKLYKISQSSNISINKISMIYNIVQDNKKDCFTSKELADLCNLSTRSINRLINKLESSGACQVVGKKIINDSGRPSRIIKFKF